MAARKPLVRVGGRVKQLPAGDTLDGLGTAALEDIGTSGGNVPLLSAANTWSADQTLDADLIFGTANSIRTPNNGTETDSTWFTSSNTNTNANVRVHPNGTAGASGFIAMNNSDVLNASRMQFFINAAAMVLAANFTGAGSYLPMVMQAGGVNRLRIETTGVINPGANGTQDLGSISLKFKEGFFTTVTATNVGVSGVLILATYTVGTMPSAAANPRGQIFVSNLASGAEPCFSDGTNWRQYSTRGIAA